MCPPKDLFDNDPQPAPPGLGRYLVTLAIVSTVGLCAWAAFESIISLARFFLRHGIG
jgi:hypothetical protein